MHKNHIVILKNSSILKIKMITCITCNNHKIIKMNINGNSIWKMILFSSKFSKEKNWNSCRNIKKIHKLSRSTQIKILASSPIILKMNKNLLKFNKNLSRMILNKYRYHPIKCQRQN